MIQQNWIYNPITKTFTNHDLDCTIIWNSQFKCWQVCKDEKSWLCRTLEQAFEEADLF
jgi:hypothetical protein